MRAIWTNTYKFLYNIEIDGTNTRVFCDKQLNYKKTIDRIKKEHNAKKVFITYLGKANI